MSENKKVSIIVPVYNKEKYLTSCLTSIEGQTYKNIEVLLVDDGSVDGSADICKMIVKRDRRFKYVYQKNCGQIPTRQRGLQISTSEYVTFIDADDRIKENYIETLMKPINEDEELDLVTSGLIYNEKNKSWIQKDSIAVGIYDEIKIKHMLDKVIYNVAVDTQGIIHSMSGKIFRKNLLERTFTYINPKLTLWEDGITVFTYICMSKKIKIMDYAGYFYIQYDDSTIHSIRDDDISTIEDLKNNYIEVSKEFHVYEITKKEIAKQISLAYAVAIGRIFGLKYNMQYEIPVEMQMGKWNIVIYGAGKRGNELKEQLDEYENIHIVDWIDINYKNIHREHEVHGIEGIEKLEFDGIIIAIENRKVVHEVIDALLSMGIEYRKIYELEKKYSYV